MSQESFHVQSHIIPACHLRGVDRGGREDNNAFRLAVKQYTPQVQADDATLYTFIVAHGIGSAKEAFEPFFDELLRCGVPIRNIWAIDAAHNGESYALNRDVIGDEIDWLDYARDIFQMINYFQVQMRPPIIGVGHSLGSGCINMVASWHPRLFAGIAMLDPALGPTKGISWPTPLKFYPGIMALRRKDIWSSREEAAEKLRRNPFYAAFDSRVFEKVMQYEIRQTIPTDDTSLVNGVARVTPKEMEVYMWIAPDPPLKGFNVRHDRNVPLEDVKVFDGIVRPEAYRLHEVLQTLYPPVFYLWGRKSPVNVEDYRKQLLGRIGIGAGGNGGVKAGKVQEASVDAGHMLVHEKPTETAKLVAHWLTGLTGELRKVRKEKEFGAAFVKGVQPELIERFSKL